MSQISPEFCPVPLEQQPINEYEQLKESWFFRWPTLDQWGYWRKLSWCWLWGWIISGPIASACYPPPKYPFLFGLCATTGSGIVLTLMVIRLYLGWSYIGDRLNQEKIIYEESGWYDGQAWEKPPSIIKRDRLIVFYKIQPILDRLKQTLLIFVAIAISLTIIWLFL
jgi:hypothetical protein